MNVETGMQMHVATPHLGEELQALLDRELPPQREAAAQAHLGACESCSAEHARLSAAVLALEGMGRARAPQGFAGRVLRRMRMQRKGYPLRALSDNKLQFEGVVIVFLAAAAAAALVVAYEVKMTGGMVAKNEPVVVAPR